MSSKAGLLHFSHVANLFPEPLRVRKRQQRSLFRPRAIRKASTRVNESDTSGGLDDLISEIAEGLFYYPPQNAYPQLSQRPEHSSTPEEPFAWRVAPLPVSRVPSTEPLTVRKTRTSESSAGHAPQTLEVSRGWKSRKSSSDQSGFSFSLDQEGDCHRTPPDPFSALAHSLTYDQRLLLLNLLDMPTHDLFINVPHERLKRAFTAPLEWMHIRKKRKTTSSGSHELSLDSSQGLPDCRDLLLAIRDYLQQNVEDRRRFCAAVYGMIEDHLGSAMEPNFYEH
ncbi:hypothetical protein BDV96DRAFT_650790 [Lophiotrema nucula]|uniref:Uncharacterized protein n=1 Tax=Lophiotrema nucula TaxID=690887 RepID=A0A6A5YU80_9PLEO|nr:hypothetical protein BDV96DRAFT_650790 [Lophiotrema nucula]